MKVLYISPYIPSRIRVRTYSLITELAKQHEVHVIALRDTKNIEQLPGKDDLQEKVSSLKIVDHPKLKAIAQSFIAIPTTSPMCTAYCWSRPLQREINDFLSKNDIDVIHIEHLRAAHFYSNSDSIPIVFDSVDCLTELFSQMAKSNEHSLISRSIMKEEAWKLRRYEPKLLGRFNKVLTTTEIERQSILNLNQNIDASVVPNGVDTDYFHSDGGIRQPGRIVFTGKMSYSPNAQASIWFATNIMPYIRDRYPFAEFVIVGSNPPRDVMNLAGMPGIKVTGYVSDIRSELDSCSIAVAPMQIAAGIQNKILEAMAMSLPVVASKISVRAFGDNHPGIIETESADEMIQAICSLIESPEQAIEIGNTGRDEVCKKYSWKASASQISDIYHQLTDNR